jgi:GT2 family glycosyltransferase
VDVVLVDHRTPELTARALQGLSGAPLARRVVVRTEGREEPGLPGVDVCSLAGNPGFAAAANLGAARGRAPWILFLNPDCFPSAGDVEELLARARALPGAAAVGPHLIGPDGVAARAGGVDLAGLARWLERLGPRRGLTEVDWVAGTCLLVRREAWAQVGGFDESYFLYCEDVDLCRRLRRRGWRVAVAGSVGVAHLGGASFPDEATRRAAYRRARRLYLRRHGGRLARLGWWALQRWRAA